MYLVPLGISLSDFLRKYFFRFTILLTATLTIYLTYYFIAYYVPYAPGFPFGAGAVKDVVL